jgi:hypothetical protein
MKPILNSLGVLAFLLLAVPALAAADSADGCELDLAAILAAKEAPVCGGEPGDLIGAAQPKPLALAEIHCCGTGARDACRDFCRQQGPSCKGTIGCRAGECVCTCSC